MIKYCTLVFAALCLLVCAAESKEGTTAGLRNINGTQLFVKIMGSGGPVVILHGGPGLDHSYFLPHLQELSSDFQLIFFDQRTSGRSSFQDVDSTEVSLSHFIEDIEELRLSLGLGKIHLLGHSFGGLLAMKYAINFPENLKSLLLINSTAASHSYFAQTNELMKTRMTKKDSLERAAILESESFKQGKAESYRKLFLLTFALNFYDRSKIDSLRLYIPDDYIARSVRLQHLFADMASYDFYEDLKHVKCPTLVLRGSDECLPMEATERIHRNLPFSKLVVLQECGHFPFVECKGKFFSEVRAFLRDPWLTVEK